MRGVVMEKLVVPNSRIQDYLIKSLSFQSKADYVPRV